MTIVILVAVGMAALAFYAGPSPRKPPKLEPYRKGPRGGWWAKR